MRTSGGRNKLPAGTPAAAAWESPWPLHSQKPTDAPGAARLTTPEATLRPYAGNDLRRQPTASGSHQATSLSAAPGNAQPEEAKQHYGHRHITKPQKSLSLMSTAPSTLPAPPCCRSKPEAPPAAPARPESATPATYRIRKRVAAQQGLINAGHCIRRNQLLTLRSRGRTKQLINQSFSQPFHATRKQKACWPSPSWWPAGQTQQGRGPLSHQGFCTRWLPSSTRGTSLPGSASSNC